ncbi:MAG: hypothetical protein PWP20_1015, partial [Eubacteriaceae bacterium]|nr:hypothetical protein [Eubacteriaceae bacterium]
KRSLKIENRLVKINGFLDFFQENVGAI